jgi:hypothetical protein
MGWWKCRAIIPVKWIEKVLTAPNAAVVERRRR